MSSRSETSLTDRKYVPESLKWLGIVSGILILLGFLNIYSATSYMNIESGVSPYSHLQRHVLFFLVSAVAACFLARCPMSFIRNGSLVWGIGIAFLLLLVFMAGRNVNGATRWISLGPLSVQPSEFAKVVGLIWTASHLAKLADAQVPISIIPRFLRPFLLFGSKKREDSFAEMFRYFKPIYLPLLFAVLVLKQPDMGTAGMILIFPLLLYVICGMSWKEVMTGFLLGVIAFFSLSVISPYRWARLIVLWDPFAYAQDEGFQTVQSLIAVGSGGIFGQGIGEGMSKFLYLPEQYTDFAFAVFAQEFGLIGSVAVLSLYVAFLFFGFMVAKELRETYPALLVYGLTMMISVQGMVNIAMVIGIFPVTGIPLPFISFGGSSLLTNCSALGLIWGTTVQSLRKVDEEERKKRIAAMEGRNVSLGRLSQSVYYESRRRY